MSTYFTKGRGWKGDFILKRKRFTTTYYKTKSEAKQAVEKRKEEILNPPPPKTETTPTDMAFLELVNKRLDYSKVYNSERHYAEYVSLAKRWIKLWGNLQCSEITRDNLELFIINRSQLSGNTGNKELRYLRSTFNFGIKRELIKTNPTAGMNFIPVEKKLKYVPTPDDIDRIIDGADLDTQDYLWTIRDTMGRISEINRLTWQDVNLEERFIVLYTRKKRGGHLTPRKVPMTDRLYRIMFLRYQVRETDKPWVFWHRYWSRKENKMIEAPFSCRSKFMQTLCKKVGVRYFKFHAIRHSGASFMDAMNIPIGAIQRILGHENRTTTEIYLHSIGNIERQAMAVYERASEKSHPNPHPERIKGLTINGQPLDFTGGPGQN